MIDADEMDEAAKRLATMARQQRRDAEQERRRAKGEAWADAHPDECRAMAEKLKAELCR